MANYSFKPLPDVPNGTTFTGDNFTRLIPHTPAFEGKTGLKFIKCNITNCDLPADTVLEGCSKKFISFCTNLFSKAIEYGKTACSLDCEHLTSTDTITIDGVVVDTVRHYSHKGVV